MYFPDVYEQDKSKSILDGDSYDLTRFSAHEESVIFSVLETVDRKYPEPLKGIGFFNESYTIMYKPRYVLMEICSRRYESSDNPFDKLGAALAYLEKGAFFRSKAIGCFESVYSQIDDKVLAEFNKVVLIHLYSQMAKAYEGERQYQKALDIIERIALINTDAEAYYIEEKKRIQKKLDNPTKSRSRKMSESQAILEENIILAAEKFEADYRGRT